jgi:hypothetical protein
VRLNITPESKTLFVGVGRTGMTTDLSKDMGTFSIGGIKFRPQPFKWKLKTPQASLKAIPKLIKAFWKYSVSLIKNVTVEQLEGEINAGLGEPHLTGYAYGFYQATLAGIPAVNKRFRFNPDWTGLSFSGAFHASVSIPVYRIIYSTILLIFQLPFRELLKMAIGRKARLERSRKDRKSNGTDQ